MRTLSVISLGFFVFFAFIQASYATVLTGDTSWAISKFGEDTSNETFCAMAKGYNQNTVFTFAHNVKGESSIAVESGVLKLLPSKRYKLVMRSGRDYLSSFNVVPVSPKAFVLKVGEDTRLLEALKKNESILINVNSHTLEMTLDDFREAAAELKSCIGPVERMVPKPSAKKGAIPGFADYEASAQEALEPVMEKQIDKKAALYDQGQTQVLEKRELRQAKNSPYALSRPAVSARQERLSRQNNQTTASNTQAKDVQSAPVERVNRSDLSRSAAQASTSSGSNARLIDQLKEENLRLTQALVDQRKEFEQGAMGSVDFNVVRDLTEKVEVLSRENRIMRSKFEADEAGVQFLDMTTELAKMQVREKNLLVQIREQNEKIASLSKSLSQQESSVQARRSAMVESEQIAALKRQNEKLQDALASVSKEQISGSSDAPVSGEYSTSKIQSAYSNALQSMRSRIAELETENQALKQRGYKQAAQQEMAKAQPEPQKERTSLSDERTAQWALKKMQRRFEQSEQENKRLGRLLSQARANRERNVVAENLQTPASQPLVPRSLAMADRGAKMAAVSRRQKPDMAISLLKNADISLDSGIRKLSDVSSSGFSVYQWESDGNFGTIEITEAAGSEVLDTLHNAYIEKARRRCQGSFEAIPAEFSTTSGNALAYDIACVDGPNSSAVASLYFLYKEGNFITFAVETTADQFDQAMSLRDKLIKSSSAS